jgi:hypothetical protein
MTENIHLVHWGWYFIGYNNGYDDGYRKGYKLGFKVGEVIGHRDELKYQSDKLTEK